MFDAEGRYVKWAQGGKIRRTRTAVPRGSGWWFQDNPESAFLQLLKISDDREIKAEIFPYETVEDV